MNFVDTSRSDYQSYLLRLWRDEAKNVWRASLQNTATEEVYHFMNVAALSAFLKAHTNLGQLDEDETRDV